MNTTDNQKELFDRVNENDEVIGQATRGEAHSDSRIIHRTIGVAIFNHRGELLMQKRSLTKDKDPGFWGISAAGHVNSEDDYLTAAVREVKEELGISVKTTDLQFLFKAIILGDSDTEMSILYKMIHEGPFNFDRYESSQVKFFAVKDLEKLIYAKEIEVTRHTLINLQYICGILPKRQDLQQYIVKIFK